MTATAPAAKVTACEDYLEGLPNSVVKSDVLNQLLYAYNQTGDQAKTLDAADRLLAVDPQNLRALTLEVYYRRADAEKLTDPAAKAAALDKVATYAQTGLNATKPKDVSDADFAALKAAAQPTFSSAIAADDMAKKDNAGAITVLKTRAEWRSRAADTRGAAAAVLQDVYALAQAYYTSTPPDYLNCAWYATRAANFAPAPYQAQIGHLASPTATRSSTAARTATTRCRRRSQTNLDPPGESSWRRSGRHQSRRTLSGAVESRRRLTWRRYGAERHVSSLYVQYGKPEDADKGAYRRGEGQGRFEIPDCRCWLRRLGRSAAGLRCLVAGREAGACRAGLLTSLRHEGAADQRCRLWATAGRAIGTGTYAIPTRSLRLMITMS